MSTGKTENIGLNQWVRSDEFNMDEFNEDNRKTDAAVTETRRMLDDAVEVVNESIASVAEGNMIVRLMDITIEESGINTINIDTQALDLSKYIQLMLYDTSSPSGFVCRMNKWTTGYVGHSSLGSGSVGGGNHIPADYGYLCFHLSGGRNWVDGITTKSYHNNVGGRNMHTLYLMAGLNATDYFDVGRKFTIVGVKI